MTILRNLKPFANIFPGRRFFLCFGTGTRSGECRWLGNISGDITGAIKNPQKNTVSEKSGIIVVSDDKVKKGVRKMKEISLWKCEICGTEYKEKAACKKCEEGHKTNGKIVGMRHLPYSSDQSGYPDRITVKFENGVEKVYKR